MNFEFFSLKLALEHAKYNHFWLMIICTIIQYSHVFIEFITQRHSSRCLSSFARFEPYQDLFFAFYKIFVIHRGEGFESWSKMASPRRSAALMRPPFSNFLQKISYTHNNGDLRKPPEPAQKNTFIKSYLVKKA